MELPLVERELTRHAKRPGTYALRMIMGAVTMMFVGFMVLSFLGRGVADPSTVSAGLVNIARTLQFAAAALLPALLTSGLIATEKEEHTLGLLLIADFSGVDVYFSKLLSAFVYILMLIIGTLPVLAFAAFLGGVSVGLIAAQVVLFSIFALTSCSIGMLFSILTSRRGVALLLSLGTTIGLLMADVLYGSNSMSSALPLGQFHIALVAYTFSAPGASLLPWQQSVVLSLAVFVCCSGISIVLLPRLGYETVKPRSKRHRRRAQKKKRSCASPYVEILRRSGGGIFSGLRSPIARLMAALLLMVIAPVPCVGPVFLCGLLALDVTSSMNAARRGGVFDDLRLTSPNPEQFVRDLYRAQLRRCFLFFPALVFCGNLGMSFTLFMSFVNNNFMAASSLLRADTSATAGILNLSPLGLGIALLLGVALLGLAFLELRLILAITCAMNRDSKMPGVQVFLVLLNYLIIMLVSMGASGLAGGLSTWFWSYSNTSSAVTSEWSLTLTLFMMAAIQSALLLVLTKVYYDNYRRAHVRYV